MAKVKIENKIVGYRVSSEEKPQVNEALDQVTQEEPNVVRMHERLERPEMLRGTTYKIKPPVSDHAMYITINDIVLNQDTEHEKFRPYEIFINSKNFYKQFAGINPAIINKYVFPEQRNSEKAAYRSWYAKRKDAIKFQRKDNILFQHIFKYHFFILI